MKILNFTVPLFLIMTTLISTHAAFGLQCSPSGYTHYGPSRQSIPCYLVSPGYGSLTLEDQFGNMTNTKIVHDGAVLILNQTMPKLAYKSGENITTVDELMNTGNKSVDIKYSPPLVVLEIKNQTGGLVWPKSTLFGVIPELQDVKTIKPGERFDIKPWESYRGSIPTTPKLYGPGNYTLISVALFTFNTHTENVNADEILWSKPLQITVLPENTQNETYSSMQNSPEFPFAIPVLLTGITLSLVFYRLKIRR